MLTKKGKYENMVLYLKIFLSSTFNTVICFVILVMQRRLSPILLFITTIIVEASTMSTMEMKLNISYYADHRRKYMIISSQIYYPSIPTTYYLLKGTFLSENVMRITQVKCIGGQPSHQSCISQSGTEVPFFFDFVFPFSFFKIYI